MHASHFVNRLFRRPVLTRCEKTILMLLHRLCFENQVFRNWAFSHFKTIRLVFGHELYLEQIFKSSIPTNLKIKISVLAHDSYFERHFSRCLCSSSFEHVLLALEHGLYSENRLLTI